MAAPARGRLSGGRRPLAAGLVLAVAAAALAGYLYLRPAGGPEAAVPGHRVVADAPLTGGTGRFDYASLDPQRHLLYVAHLGASSVVVVDTQANRVVREVPGVEGVHGVVAVPEAGRVYATATGANQLAVIDAASGAVVARVPTGDYPDGLAYDADDRKVFVSNEHGGTVTVVDAAADRRLADVDLGGDTGNTQYDGRARRVYAAAGVRRQLVEIDPASHQVVDRIDLPGCDRPHGVQLDPPKRTAYVACEGNARLVAVDLASRRVGQPQPVGDRPDVLALDPGLHRLYVAAESGLLSVFQVDGLAVRKTAEGNAGPDAHVVAVDPTTHLVYLPLRNLGGQPVLRVLAPADAG